MAPRRSRAGDRRPQSTLSLTLHNYDSRRSADRINPAGPGPGHTFPIGTASCLRLLTLTSVVMFALGGCTSSNGPSSGDLPLKRSVKASPTVSEQSMPPRTTGPRRIEPVISVPRVETFDATDFAPGPERIRPAKGVTYLAIATEENFFDRSGSSATNVLFGACPAEPRCGVAPTYDSGSVWRMGACNEVNRDCSVSSFIIVDAAGARELPSMDLRLALGSIDTQREAELLVQGTKSRKVVGGFEVMRSDRDCFTERLTVLRVSTAGIVDVIGEYETPGDAGTVC
jgi:hypothetical protein